MHRSTSRFAAMLGAALLLASCAKAPTEPGPGDDGGGGGGGPVLPDPNVVPTVAREFRGLWVATVSNIDWPSKSGLTVSQQQAELASLLDRAAAAGFNGIVLQVRPAGDALYRSELEPWGAMLTGTQGVDPGWDPLAYAVQQAHARGMELHAWINPFRAGNTSQRDALAQSHLANTNPELVLTYGTQLWMDPGEPAVHDHTLRVALDIVQRYDVDALHLDDYFYPYVQTNASGPIPFPDTASYRKYGGGVALADWRRANVDGFLERLYAEVHALRPWVRVGISPFGIWRPGHPAGITGLDAYTSIYADSRKWLQNGWLDYLAPQLYWAIDPPQQSFPALLAWWQQQNTRGRHVWPGLATYKVYEGPQWPVSEILNQVAVTRTRNTHGVLFYNTSTTLTRNNAAVANALDAGPFADLALPPAHPWLDDTAPGVPQVTVGTSLGGGWSATVTPADEPVRWWLVRYRASSRWYVRTIFGSQASLTLTAPADAKIDWVVLNAVDNTLNMSAPFTWKAGG